jgi:hypothetical protein
MDMNNQMPPMQPNFGMPPMQNMPASNNTTNEEIIEAIIDEKWNSLLKDITKIIEWKAQAQEQVTRLDQQFNDLRNQFDRLHDAIIAKIGEYDKNILDVGAEIQSMEKVFAKVLPVFTENVSELTRITDDLKGLKSRK